MARLISVARWRVPSSAHSWRRVLPLAFALALLVLFTSCASTTTQNEALAITPTPSVNTLARIHGATAESIPLFVRVSFTHSTTYDQAVAILSAQPTPAQPYPWTCDEPHSPTPPPLAERQTAFAATHALLLSYATWSQLTRIAATSQVIAVDGAVVYPCA